MLNFRNSYSGLRGQASLSKILNRVTCHIVSSCDFCAFTLHISRDLLARSTAPRQLSLLRSRRICTLPASYHATKRLFPYLSTPSPKVEITSKPGRMDSEQTAFFMFLLSTAVIHANAALSIGGHVLLKKRIEKSQQFLVGRLTQYCRVSERENRHFTTARAGMRKSDSSDATD